MKKYLAALAAAFMLLSGIDTVHAEDQKINTTQKEMSVNSFLFKAELASETEVYEFTRNAMVQRTTPIEIRTICAKADKDFIYTILDQAMAHTGNPKEGDYLRYQWESWDCNYYPIDYGMYYKLAMKYYTNASQEAVVDQRVRQIISELQISTKSDYEKIREVYLWIARNVKYASASDTNLKYTAYGALNGRALCQGYAVLFYRMMLELGIDCRVITGKGKETSHAWNIVKLGSYYYNIDVTWAATSGNRKSYFLKGSSDFPEHQAAPEFQKADFRNKYPMASADYVHKDSDDYSSGTSSYNTMYRLYNKNSGEHFFTANAGERDALVKFGWQYEGIGWYAPKTSVIPVFRLYNKNGGEHHYTTMIKEKEALIKNGWTDEGIGWFSDSRQQIPLFRVSNPTSFANNHHYTASEAERDALVESGWKDEGIGWYGAE